MIPLVVPEPYRDALLGLAHLSDTVADSLIAAVDDLEAFSAVSTMQATARAALPDSDPGTARLLIPSLLALRGQVRDATSERLGRELSQSDDINLSQPDRERLGARVTALLSTAAVSTTAIAVELQTQHERNFSGASIFTDVRPVFPDDVSDGPAGVVIVEMLQIQTWDRNGESGSVFVALDEADLVKLKGVVDRALKKTEALKASLAERDLVFFELEEEADDQGI